MVCFVRAEADIAVAEASHYLHQGLPAPASQTNSDATFATIEWWLSDCSTNHKLCSIGQDEYDLPMRLVDVGHNDKTKPRICLSKDLPSATQYMTLSHCWGQAKFETLTRDNYKLMQTEIPSSALTRTFRDAMEITRQLGHRYIWIDSLCIVQGDEDDWSREARKMGSIYQNSVLNLASGRGPDGRDGCFTQRDPARLHPCRVLSQWDEPENRCIYICHDPELHSREAEETVLQSRG